MNRSAATSDTTSLKAPRSRLPLSNSSSRLTVPQAASTRLTTPSPTRLTHPSPTRPTNPSPTRPTNPPRTHLSNPSPTRPSSSTLRVPVSPAVRLRTTSTNAKPSSSTSTVPSPIRLRKKSSAEPLAVPRNGEPELPAPTKGPSMSVKEAIALKRAEAKKAMAAQKAGSRSASSGWDGLEGASPAAWAAPVAESDDLGRPSVRETIERARSSGSLNIASRDLPCIPSALFEIHLSVTPEKLASVPDEPPLPENPTKKAGSNSATWYDQQDLTFLRARNNQIVELQPEISLFGSLKTIDLQNNRLASLPDSFADLTSLVNLDLSHNTLTRLPPYFFALPALSTLSISHNALTALPFNMPFEPDTKATAPSRRSSDFFSAPDIKRATRPLPSLASLDASHNKIDASAIHHDALPLHLASLNLIYNPLGDVTQLMTSLSYLTQLNEVRMSKCGDINDTHFPSTLLSSVSVQSFPQLAILDLEETRVTQAGISAAFANISQALDFEAPATDPRAVAAGRLVVVVGKRIIREAWEIEADQHVQRLRERRSAANLHQDAAPTPELPPPPPPPPLRPVIKEQWEIDAEQGLFSEGARRRARAQAAQREGEEAEAEARAASVDVPSALSRHWDARTHTLTLPSSSPARRTTRGAPSPDDSILPRATLPLALITVQPFANTLRVLELRGRRAEPTFLLPDENSGPFLPQLEILTLEGCALNDVVSGTDVTNGGTLGALTRLFPSLHNLDLSYNDLTGNAFSCGVLKQLAFAGDGRAGLKRLGLCGNKMGGLDGLSELARSIFSAGAKDIDEEQRGRWTLEELDVRENSIAVLPSELGLLPLEVFLVDGNLFRVPPRRVWEREGTKGLMAWLGARLESP